MDIKKIYGEPSLELFPLSATDLITTSGDLEEDDDENKSDWDPQGDSWWEW